MKHQNLIFVVGWISFISFLTGIHFSCGTPENKETNTVLLADCDKLKDNILNCSDYPRYCDGFTITIAKDDGACRWKY